MILKNTAFADDAAMAQSALQEAVSAGETLIIPRVNPRTGGDFYVFPRAVELPSHAHIVLDGCHIVHAEGTFDNLFKSLHCRMEAGRKRENRLCDISVTGRAGALLDGGVHNGLTETTRAAMGMSCFQNSAIHFQNVEDFEIAGFAVTEPRYWCLTFHHCAWGSIHDIRFDCSGAGPNQDGVDLRRGCHDITIHDLFGFTGDDVVALTNLSGGDLNCAVEGESGDIRRVVIRDLICASSEERGIVRLLCNNGTEIHDVVIDTVIDASSPERFLRSGSAVRINELGYFKEGLPLARCGQLSNITVRNIVTRARIGVELSCHAENVVIDNVQMREDAATALLFRDGDIRHIRARNLSYTDGMRHPETDDNTTEGPNNKRKPSQKPPEERKVCAVYFQNAHVRDVRIDGLRAGKDLTSVFGGGNSEKVVAQDVVRLDENVPMIEGSIPLDIRD